MDNSGQRITKYFEKHRTETDIDDITCNDLDLDAVFDRINKTSSSLGEEMLYYILRSPQKKEDSLCALENNIEYYLKAENEKKKTVAALSGLSKLKKTSVFEYLDKLDEIRSIKSIVLFMPMILILAGIVCIFFNATAGILVTAAAFIINTIRYFKLQKDIRPYLICFSYVFKAIRASRMIAAIKDDEIKGLLPLTRGNFILGNLSGVSANGGSGNPFDLLLDLLRMSLHLDIIRFYHLSGRVRASKDRIEALLVHMGYVDAYIAIGEYRKSLDTYCIPHFEHKKHLKCDDLYHPLLKAPVKNSVDTEKSILITGSNASGKSTFLRSLAINILFAQTIHTVLASEYEAPLCLLATSMSIRDNLLKNESYYMAEIRSVKRILELSDNDNGFVMCFVDELLKGTNTLERIAASSEILKELDKSNIFCFASTHDIELTSILEGVYDNMHFKEEIINDDISFSYRLLPGKSNTTNAIRLLISMDFPDEVVDRAVIRLKNFNKTGKWQF